MARLEASQAFQRARRVLDHDESAACLLLTVYQKCVLGDRIVRVHFAPVPAVTHDSIVGQMVKETRATLQTVFEWA